jgi:hypothetical protein
MVPKWRPDCPNAKQREEARMIEILICNAVLALIYAAGRGFFLK